MNFLVQLRRDLRMSFHFVQGPVSCGPSLRTVRQVVRPGELTLNCSASVTCIGRYVVQRRERKRTLG